MIEFPYRPIEYWSYRSYGPDPSKDCGLTIRNASRLDHGSWSISPDNIDAFVTVKGDCLDRIRNVSINIFIDLLFRMI